MQNDYNYIGCFDLIMYESRYMKFLIKKQMYKNLMFICIQSRREYKIVMYLCNMWKNNSV